MAYNILIAEDDLINRKVIRAILKGIGITNIYDAENGLQALQCLSRNEIDLIILDLIMPEKDGFEVLEEMMSKEEYKYIPVIVYSAVENLDKIKKALDMGAYDYFIKPLTREQKEILLPSKIRNATASYEQRKQLQKLNEKLQEEIKLVKYKSYHDSLTGLYNRAYFDIEAGRYDKDMSRSYPLTIISIDVDGLKTVNDIFGHKAGDELLKTAASIISDCFRKTEIAARIGGDEFCIILPDTDEKVGNKRVNYILDSIDRYNEDKHVIALSMSVGYATTRHKRQSIYDLCRIADDNMYKEKALKSGSYRKEMINSILQSLNEKDYLSKGHGDRIQVMAEVMSERINLNDDEKHRLILLARVHDLGKVGIPEQILDKPEKLTEEEYERVKEHSRIGYNIAKLSDNLKHVAEMILYHHERYDGTGYPMGLKGSEIPIECRILAILDTYDSMTSERPYRKGVSTQQAINEIVSMSGLQFDPDLVNRFCEVMDSGFPEQICFIKNNYCCG